MSTPDCPSKRPKHDHAPDAAAVDTTAAAANDCPLPVSDEKSRAKPARAARAIPDVPSETDNLRAELEAVREELKVAKRARAALRIRCAVCAALCQTSWCQPRA